MKTKGLQFPDRKSERYTGNVLVIPESGVDLKINKESQKVQRPLNDVLTKFTCNNLCISNTNQKLQYID